MKAIVAEFPGKVGACALCPGRGKGRFKSTKHGGLIRHVAMAHGKVDEFMKDEELVKAKRLEEMGGGVTVKKEEIGGGVTVKKEEIGEEVEAVEETLKEEPVSS